MGDYNTSLESMCPAKSDIIAAEISSFGECISVPSTSYHTSYSFCYVIGESSDYNNT